VLNKKYGVCLCTLQNYWRTSNSDAVSVLYGGDSRSAVRGGIDLETGSSPRVHTQRTASLRAGTVLFRRAHGKVYSVKRMKKRRTTRNPPKRRRKSATPSLIGSLIGMDQMEALGAGAAGDISSLANPEPDEITIRTEESPAGGLLVTGVEAPTNCLCAMPNPAKRFKNCTAVQNWGKTLRKRRRVKVVVI